MRILVYLFFLIISFSSVSQEFLPGYILTLQGDTIKGEAFYGSHSKYDECRFVINGKEETFSPDQIEGYGIYGIRAYTSQIIPSTFVEEVGIGTISLYKNDNYYALTKEGESNLVLNRNKFENGKVKGRYLGSIKYIMSDCELKHNFEKMSLSERSLIKLISRYNECKGSAFVSIKEDLPAFSFEMGPAVGYNFFFYKNKFPNSIFNSGALSPDGLEEKYESSYPSYGLNLIVGFPRISDRFSIQSGIAFSKLGFGGTKEATSGGDLVYYTSDFSFSSTSVPFLFRYNLWKPSLFTFRVIAGVEYQFYELNKSHTLIVRRYNEFELSNIYEMEDGFFGTFGIQGEYSFNKVLVGSSISYNSSFSYIGKNQVSTYVKFINTSLFVHYKF